ncbi:Diguanylate cyclase, GGDEF domain [Oscillibacter sp. PC13]|uniref:EAL domain-containing protein n=1 Tax=Oscillibacter sp. PC13 TaxID=1855299 RepID=UPI0008F2FF91|nr:GGDEF domain-containing phosphodiesterase [Oscillibacter sp. PC13]SFP32800.1 Diguanylate cyclase, GGDEF domain [Oscillibacter sp. PC13]
MHHPDRDYDIICSDVENFKLINNVLGKKAEDDLLFEIAICCRTYTRPDGLCGRLDSDRFVCLVERGRTYTNEIFIDQGKRSSILSNNKIADIKWGLYPIDERYFPMDQMCDRAMLAVQSIKAKYGCYFAIYDNSLPKQLHLESTESVYAENPQQPIQAVSCLRELGFIIEMDDFGSGHSSLNMLNQMPIDILMKFIQSETAKPLEQGILQFIVNLARWMHVSMVAEGVETREQLDRLMEVDCNYVQGIIFPTPCQRRILKSFWKKKSCTANGQETFPLFYFSVRVLYKISGSLSVFHYSILFSATADLAAPCSQSHGSFRQR